MILQKDIDLPLIAATIIALAIGIIMIYSAVNANESITIKDSWLKQAQYAVTGLILSASFLFFPKKFIYSISYPLYLFGLISLLAVLLWGTGSDAQRWLRLGPIQIQPSEFTKLFMIIGLARYLSDASNEVVNSIVGAFKAATIITIPMAMVIQQPDLGTALSFFAPLIPMLYWAGMRKIYLFFFLSPLISVVCSFEPLWMNLAPYLFAIFMIASSFMIHVALRNLWYTMTAVFVNLSSGLTTVYLWDHFLLPYQKSRIMTFLDPESDRLGSGWNIIQSKIAIGSGGFTGKGYLNGTQTKYEFLPAAHTDFIFSVIGEELGFIGAVAILFVFLFIIIRALKTSYSAKNRFHSLIAIGIASMIAFHVFVNIGMTIGVMPVTGLPLPFISAGGSSLLVNLLYIGLLLHIFANRHEY